MEVIIAEAVASAMKTTGEEAMTTAFVDEDFQTYVVSLVDKASTSKMKVTIAPTPPQVTATTSVPASAVSLNSILGRLKK